MPKRYYQLKNGKITRAEDGMTTAEVRRDYLPEFREYQREKHLKQSRESASKKKYFKRENIAFYKNDRDRKLHAHLVKQECKTTYVKGLIERDLQSVER